VYIYFAFKNTNIQFYNYTTGQCVQYKRLRESCTEYSQCLGQLVCDRTPYLNQSGIYK
jgi:hypothetical protein